jgi:hypothetical protein
MGWAEIRRRARRTVHSTFVLPAVYTSADGLTSTPCMARKHNEKKVFGDLDREGFAQVIEDVNQVIFDSIEVQVERNGRVDFGNGEVFEIVNLLPATTDEFQRVEVTLYES